MRVNVWSTFSGIGGIDLGLERAGMRVTLQAEQDAYRRAVLAERFPGVTVFDDVCAVGEPARRALANGRGAPVDERRREAGPGLLCGGFPCQDLSVAGRRKGLAGDRSGLFFEFARIADTVRPGYLLVENVPGLLSSQGGRDFGTVLGTLADIGYGLGYRILDSRFFGVPQRRRRVFILGILADDDPARAARRAGEILAVGSRCPGHPATGTQAGPDVAAAPLSGTLGGRRGFTERGHRDLMSEGFDGSPDGDRGFNIVSFDAEQSFQQPSDQAYLTRKLRRAVSDGQMVRRLTPVECERLQGFPDGWTQLGGTEDSKRYAALGDAVTVNVAEWIGHRIMGAVA